MIIIKKKLFTTILFFALLSQLKTQTWAWLNGSSPSTTLLVNPTGSYGTQGVGTPTNYPGGRYVSQFWKDLSGNFWIFGDYARITSATALCNDLWKYNPLTNIWTWMKGANIVQQYGTYGTLGVPTSSTTPGARHSGSTWMDNAGNFWLLGGSGYAASTNGYMNDLWKFNLVTNQWTWIKGSSSVNQNGVYGTISVPSASNSPGSRLGGITWTDALGDLWLFGGEGYGASGGSGDLNDTWKYTISTNEWTWMGGSSVINQTSVYGTLGVASSTSIPGGRRSSAIWKDASGDVFIFGGAGYAASGSSSFLSDLWKYSVSSGQWTWVKGATTTNQSSVYGTMGVSSSTNDPGARLAAVTWKDLSGNFWLLGGFNLNGDYGDIWKYNTGTNEWVWTAGSNTVYPIGVYGTLGVASPTNSPGSRKYSGSWTDGAGDLCLFGGQGVTSISSALFNDVWKYEICSVAGTPTNISTASNLSNCNGGTSTVSVSSDAPVSWYASASSTVSLGTGTNYVTGPLTTGTYSYYAGANLCLPSASRAVVIVTVNPLPTIAVTSGSICSGSAFTIVPTGASTYTYSGGNSIVSPVNTTSYSITGKSAAGCLSSNVAVCFVTVNPTPTLVIAGQFTLCNGFSSNLIVNGASSYTWSNTSFSSSILVTPSVTSTYSVVGETAFGCKNSSSKTVTVYALPQISATSGSICIGNSFTIVPGGAFSYSYSSGNAIVTPSSNSVYTVTGSSAQGCLSSNSVVVNVTVAPLPSFTISGNNYVCLGSSVSQLINGSAVSYTWSNGSTNNLITVSPTVNTSYSVIVTGSNGCKNFGSKLINVYALPFVSSLANNTLICAGDTLILNGQGASTYSWTGNVMNNTVFYPTTTGTYTVTGVDLNNCSNTATIMVAVNALPIVQANTSTSLICVGEPVILQASGALTYSWNTGVNGATITVTPLVTSMYTVTGTDANGCINNTTILQEVDACAGIGNKLIINRATIAIYPNPNNGEFSMELNAISPTTSVEIYTSLGELLLKYRPENLIHKVNLQDAAKGIYVIVIREGNQAVSRVKVIIE